MLKKRNMFTLAAVIGGICCNAVAGNMAAEVREGQQKRITAKLALAIDFTPPTLSTLTRKRPKTASCYCDGYTHLLCCTDPNTGETECHYDEFCY